MGIGLFGGTFDPIHFGHLELAELALESCALDQVLFLPSASPPHKCSGGLASFEHRAEMIRLAIEDYPNFMLLEVEKKIAAPNYTVDTLKYLLENNLIKENLAFIIGLDAFLDIHLWKQHEQVLKTIDFIIAARSGHRKEELESFLVELNFERQHGYWYNSSSRKKITFLDCDIPAISSSEVRQQLQKGKSPGNSVPSIVINYINQYNLYNVDKNRNPEPCQRERKFFH